MSSIRNKVLIFNSSTKLGEVAQSAGGVCHTTITYSSCNTNAPALSGTPSWLRGGVD